MSERHEQDTYHDVIATVAHDLWERDGSPPNRDLHYWLEAEKSVLRHRASSPSTPLLLRDAHASTPGAGNPRPTPPLASATGPSSAARPSRSASRTKTPSFPGRQRAISA